MSRLGEMLSCGHFRTVTLEFRCPPRDVALGRDPHARAGRRRTDCFKAHRAMSRLSEDHTRRPRYSRAEFQSPPRDVALGRVTAHGIQWTSTSVFQSPPRDVALGRAYDLRTTSYGFTCFKAHRAMSRLGELAPQFLARPAVDRVSKPTARCRAWASWALRNLRSPGASCFKAHRAMSRLGEGIMALAKRTGEHVSKPTARCRAWARPEFRFLSPEELPSFKAHRAMSRLGETGWSSLVVHGHHVSKPTARCRAWARNMARWPISRMSCVRRH